MSSQGSTRSKSIYEEPDPEVVRHHVESTALLAGISLLLLAIIAPIANFVLISSGLVVVGGLVMLIVALIDIYLAYAISFVLDPKNSRLAKLTSLSRLLYAFVLIAACFPLFFDNAELFYTIWDAALIVFGAHLLLVCLLGLNRDSLPAWICVVVGVAGIGYIADSVLMPTLNTEFAVSTITFLGEVALMIWLLFYRTLHRKDVS